MSNSSLTNTALTIGGTVAIANATNAGYVNSINQNLGTSSAPTFSSLTITNCKTIRNVKVLGINDLITTTLTGDGITYYSANGFPFGTNNFFDGIQHLFYFFQSVQGNVYSYIFIKSYEYTPVRTSSTILVNFDTNCAISGSGSDNMISWLDISQSATKYSGFTRSTALSSYTPTTMKAFLDYGNGRGGVILPIQGFLNQTTGGTCYITIGFTLNGSDDRVAVYADNTTIMKITEVG